MGWPFPRWADRFRPDPIKSLRLEDVSDEIKGIAAEHRDRAGGRGHQRRPGAGRRAVGHHAPGVAVVAPPRGPLPAGQGAVGAHRGPHRGRAPARPGARLVAAAQGVAVRPGGGVRVRRALAPAGAAHTGRAAARRWS
ncbi:hypothetical protein ACFSTC_10905 [Nonomuraea ferruginea]